MVRWCWNSGRVVVGQGRMVLWLVLGCGPLLVVLLVRTVAWRWSDSAIAMRPNGPPWLPDRSSSVRLGTLGRVLAIAVKALGPRLHDERPI